MIEVIILITKAVVEVEVVEAQCAAGVVVLEAVEVVEDEEAMAQVHKEGLTLELGTTRRTPLMNGCEVEAILLVDHLVDRDLEEVLLLAAMDHKVITNLDLRDGM